jgi:hypothetical protein
MTLVTGDVLRATAKLSWGSDDIQNVYHIIADSNSANSDATILDEVIADLDNAYSAVQGPMSNAVSFDSVSLYNLTADRYMGESTWTALTVGGDTTNNLLPPMVAALARFPTATLGSQGRKFLGGFTVGSLQTYGELTSATFNSVTLFATRILNGVTGSDWTGTYGNYVVATGVFRPYVRAVINTYWCTQRRRRPGVGS